MDRNNHHSHPEPNGKSRCRELNAIPKPCRDATAEAGSPAATPLRPSDYGRGHREAGPGGSRVRAVARREKTGRNPLEIVTTTLHYFEQHFPDAIGNAELAAAIGVSEQALACSFDQVRGMTPAQALLEHRLNRLFHTLTDQPRQGLGRAIHACGLGGTQNVVALFEQTFGIEMALFLLTCRRAAEDRLFRRQHPEAEALVLPS
ncbi:MAG: helix-turn-helix domain-containing protein [Cyanobium sp.]